MLMPKYVVERDLGCPRAIAVCNTLLPADHTLQVSFTIGPLYPEETFGDCLCIHFSDAESGVELEDVILTGLPHDVIDVISTTGELVVRDKVLGIQYQVINCELVQNCIEGLRA